MNISIKLQLDHISNSEVNPFNVRLIFIILLLGIMRNEFIFLIVLKHPRLELFRLLLLQCICRSSYQLIGV